MIKLIVFMGLVACLYYYSFRENYSPPIIIDTARDELIIFLNEKFELTSCNKAILDYFN